MESDKTRDEKIQNYYNLSLTYLESAKINLERELYEPAMFNAIHALELALKSALLTRKSDVWKTHNIGGVFSKFFMKDTGKENCRRINIILSKYNLPRYPDNTSLDPDEIEGDIEFIEYIIEDVISNLL